MNNDYYFNIKRTRPEELYKCAKDYFNGDIISQYANSKSMMRIQEKITIRALELLNIEKGTLILDAGCGPGFTSIYLKEIGYNVVALDIVSDFLYYYNIKELNPINSDMCLFPFKSNTFNGIISISALQWIFRDIKSNNDRNKLYNLVSRLHSILKPYSKAIFQFYPKNNIILKEIGKIFGEKDLFEGNFIIDNPNNPIKRRIFLLIKKKMI
ncbi:MAG: class I SAM-dependent methyltransferase [Promethearchaeota archaeon]